MIVHGSFSDIRTHRRYDFCETSSGDTIIRRNWLKMADFAKICGKGAYETMNIINVEELFYSNKVINSYELR